MNEPVSMVDKLGRTRRLRPLRDRFEEKVDRDGPVPEIAPELGPCWLWTGTRLGGPKNGYGAICAGGVGSHASAPRTAHGVSYELYVGAVPAGLELDHLCEVKHCVNPAHLEPVTHAENIRRSFERRRRTAEAA